MKHAFLLQVHQNFEQIRLLIDRIIATDECDVHVHVDRKNEALQSGLLEHYQNSSRVYILKERESAYWADFSLVKVTLNLLENARSYGGYRYYSLISGQDYPIKPLSEFNQFLRENNGIEFIEAGHRANTWRVRLAHRHTRHPEYRKSRWFRYYALLQSIVRHKKKISLSSYRIYYGSQWFTITSDAVDFILKFIRDNPGFLRDFETSTCGDEHFFQTILMNSDFADKIRNDNLRFFQFASRSNSPKILTLKDYERLIESSKFIARKFDCTIDREILDRLGVFILK